LNNAMNCSLHFNFCFRDPITLHWILVKFRHIHSGKLKTLDILVLLAVLRRWDTL
jgi:hypothetical protein